MEKTSSFRDDSERGLLDEDSPLLMRHLSISRQTPSSSWKDQPATSNGIVRERFVVLLLFAGISVCLLVAALFAHEKHDRISTRPMRGVVTIEHAHQQYVPVSPVISLWVRTWGNAQGIPVLFVHGGPGNAIADYENSNANFFDAETYFVVEVDQRGTGQSHPSVRAQAANMKVYENISVDEIAADYEIVRQALHLEQWLVFGGSFGSTVALFYATQYSEACLGLIVRGIYLDTPAEMQAVYARSSHLHSPSHLRAFDMLYNYAAQESNEWIDPNDAHALTAAYYDMIRRGDRQASWHWFAYENNLMETDPANLLDPEVVDRKVFPQAQSVAFFETRLWLRGAYEEPLNLLHFIPHLRHVNFIEICQGRHDLVCPARYTRLLTNELDAAQAMYGVHYINSGHEQSDHVMAACLKEALHSFQSHYKM